METYRVEIEYARVTHTHTHTQRTPQGDDSMQGPEKEGGAGMDLICVPDECVTAVSIFCRTAQQLTDSYA